MTPSRLSELKELLERLPKAPWKAIPAHIAEDAAEVRVAEGWLMCCVPSDTYAEFIAAARTAVPELVAEVERLREAVEDAAQKAKVAWLTTPYGSIADADAMEAMCNDLSEQIRAALGGQP